MELILELPSFMKSMKALKFMPTDQVLVEHYLYNKLHGSGYFQGTVFDYDLYGAAEPWQIWEGFKGADGQDLYFFTQLKRSTNKCGQLSSHVNRKVGSAGGSWSAENSLTPVFATDSNDQIIGYCRRLRYENPQMPEHHGEWIMHEYSLHESYIHQANCVCSNYVLCRIRKNERVKRKEEKVATGSNERSNKRVKNIGSFVSQHVEQYFEHAQPSFECAPRQSFEFECAPQQSFKCAPQQPSEHATRQPFECAPQHYFEPAPQQSFECAPQQPFECAQQQPFECAPQQTFECALQQPFECAQQQPFESAPQHYFEPAPQQFFECAPQQPFECAQQQPFECAPQQFFECAQQQPFECAPQQTFECAQQQPFGRAQQQPFECAQQQPFECAPQNYFKCAQQQPFECAQRQPFECAEQPWEQSVAAASWEQSVVALPCEPDMTTNQVDLPNLDEMWKDIDQGHMPNLDEIWKDFEDLDSETSD